VGGSAPVLRWRDSTHGEKATARIDGSDLYFEVANSERLRIKSGGTVAIPGQGASNANPRLLIEDGTGGDNDFSISQYEDSNGTYTLIGQNVQLNGSGNSTVLDSNHKTAGILFDGRNNGSLMFNTGGTNAHSEALRINSNGMMSIGKTGNAGKAIEIYQSAYAALRIQNSSTGTGSNDGILIEAAGSDALFYNYESANVRFGTAGTEKVRITSGGFVGINETSPDNALHVKSTTDTQQIKVENTASSGRAQIKYFNPHADWQQGIIGGTTDGDFITYTSVSKNIRFYTNNTERMRIRGDGKVTIGDSPHTYNNSYLRVEAPGINVESEWDSDDNQGSSPHLSLFGSNSHVRMDMGTMDVGPYGTYIQSRFDNTPEESGTTSSGLEPLLLNPRGGALMYNIHDQDAVNGIGGGQNGTKGGFVMRAGSADSATVSNANTAIKIYPGHVRSSTPVSEQNGGIKYGGIAWNILDPHNGGWGAYNGSHCWMGMSLHSTPGQELSNWQVQMNQSGNTGSTPTNVALQATPHGYVTKPSNPAFMAMCSGSTTVTSGGNSYDLPASNEIFDTMGNYNTSNYRFTAPTDGKYFFWYNLFVYGTQSGENRWNFKKNGSDYHSLQSVMNFNNYNPWNGSIVMDLSKNDYVTCGQWQSYNGLSFYQGHTGWGGYMVG
tara:strand:- start:980 stop:2977 length:1998 start_codon:yes stop_codon:yes gene_type:complete